MFFKRLRNTSLMPIYKKGSQETFDGHKEDDNGYNKKST